MVCPEDKSCHSNRFHLPSLKQVQAYIENYGLPVLALLWTSSPVPCVVK